MTWLSLISLPVSLLALIWSWRAASIVKEALEQVIRNAEADDE